MNIRRSCKMYWLTAQLVALLAVAPLQHVARRDPAKGETGWGRRRILSGRPQGALGHDRRACWPRPRCRRSRIRSWPWLRRTPVISTRPRGRLHLRGAEGAQVLARGGDCALALRGLRLHLGLRGRRLPTPLGTVQVDKAFARQLVEDELDDAALRARDTTLPRQAPSTRSRSSCRGCKECWATLSSCPSSWETRATRAAARWAWRWRS